MTLAIVFDIHRNSLYANCFFEYTTDCVNTAEISIQRSNLYLSFCQKSKLKTLNIKMPDNFLLPCTISCISFVDKSVEHLVQPGEDSTKLKFFFSHDPESVVLQTLKIRFGIKISNSTVIENYFLESKTGTDFKDFMHDKFKTFNMFRIICSNCGTALTENNLKFQSVNKYYEGLSELTENLFCHKHEGHSSVETNTNLLYIGDMYFYFHDCLVKSFKISESSKELKCSSCLSILSLKKKMDKPQYIGFFCDKIILTQTEIESKDIENYKSDSALFSLCSVFQEQLKLADSCKIYLQSKVAETTEVLLLRINEVVQLNLHVTQVDQVPPENEFKAKEAYKVLFCVCLADSAISKKWKHDFDVEFYQISDNMMKVIKELLQRRSDLPKELNNFEFGYLYKHFSMENHIFL